MPDPFLLVLLLHASVAWGETTRGDRPLTLWHAFDKRPAQALQTIIAEFSRRQGVTVKLESGIDLTVALAGGQEETADAVLAPSDLISRAGDFDLSPIPAELMPLVEGSVSPASVRLNGRAFGVPVLAGNHLLLYYDRARVKAPAATWEELRRTVAAAPKSGRMPPVALDFGVAYNLAAFMLGFGAQPVVGGRVRLAGPACEQALTFYQGLATDGVVDARCGYECVTSGFYQRRYPYAIQGDWILLEAEEALGSDLGLAPLPALPGGRALTSYRGTHALIFPRQSLTGPRGQALRELARYLAAPDSQRRFFETARRLPASRKVFGTLAAGARPEARALFAAHELARPVPDDPAVALLWLALGRGFKQLQTGTKTAAETCRYMDELAARGSGK